MTFSVPQLAVQVEELIYHPAGLRALIYRPEHSDTRLLPAAVCVHGGAWVSGDRTVTQRMASHLAGCGMVVMAIDFRMGQAQPYPAALQDINYATRWLKLHADDYGVNAARVGGAGVSSGGHLVLLSAMRPFDARYTALLLPEVQEQGLDARLTFVLTCSGVLDPVARYEMAQAAPYADIVACHDQYFGSREVMDEASPPRILQRGESVTLPPALFFQGGKDTRLPADTAKTMASLYKQQGAYAAAHVFAEAGHATSEWPVSLLDEVSTQLAKLLEAAA